MDGIHPMMKGCNCKFLISDNALPPVLQLFVIVKKASKAHSLRPYTLRTLPYAHAAVLQSQANAHSSSSDT